MTLNVGLRKVPPFEQKGLISGPRQRVGKAVAIVETCRMSPLAVLPKPLSRQVGLFFVDGHEGDPCFCDEQIQIAHSIRAKA